MVVIGLYSITDGLCFQKLDRKCSHHRCAAFDVDAPGGHSDPVLVEAASGLYRSVSLRCGTTAVEPESVNPPSTQTEPGGEYDRNSGTRVGGDKDRP